MKEKSTYEREAAKFAASIDIEETPESVQHHAKLLTADTMAAIIAGTTVPEVETLASDQATKYPGKITILGTDKTSSTAHASFVNGVSGSVLELNAGHKYAAGHPIIYLFPALLAEGERQQVEGKAFLSALVAGYEVVTRTARACEPLDNTYLPHGVWGAVGAATAVARLRDYDTNKTVTAMRLAASFAQHSHFNATLEGATGVRNGSCGLTNVNGILAADLAGTGFTGITDGLAAHLERTGSTDFDRTVLTDRLGSHWEINRGYYKMHAAGRLVHPAIDGAAKLDEKYDFAPKNITEVTVETYEKAAKWADTKTPQNRLQAKSSVSFGVATRLVHGDSGLEEFEPDAITEEVLALMNVITVTADSELDARVPDARSARVTVKLTDGKQITEEVEHARGGENNPYTESEIHEKFTRLLTPILGEQESTSLWETVQTLPRSEVAELTARGGKAE